MESTPLVQTPLDNDPLLGRGALLRNGKAISEDNDIPDLRERIEAVVRMLKTRANCARMDAEANWNTEYGYGEWGKLYHARLNAYLYSILLLKDALDKKREIRK